MALPFPSKTLTRDDIDKLNIRFDCNSLAVVFKKLSACSVSSKFVIPLNSPCHPTSRFKLSHIINQRMDLPKDRLWMDFCLGESHFQSINVMFSETSKFSDRRDFLNIFFGFTTQLDNFNESVYHGAKAYDPNILNNTGDVAIYRSDFEKLAVSMDKYLKGDTQVLFYKTSHGMIERSVDSVQKRLQRWKSASCDEADIFLVQIHKAALIAPPRNEGVLLYKLVGLDDLYGLVTKTQSFGIKDYGYFYGSADKQSLARKNITYVQGYNPLISLISKQRRPLTAYFLLNGLPLTKIKRTNHSSPVWEDVKINSGFYSHRFERILDVLGTRGAELRVQYEQNFSSIELASQITYDHEILYLDALDAGLLIHVDLKDWRKYFDEYFSKDERSLLMKERERLFALATIDTPRPFRSKEDVVKLHASLQKFYLFVFGASSGSTFAPIDNDFVERYMYAGGNSNVVEKVDSVDTVLRRIGKRLVNIKDTLPRKDALDFDIVCCSLQTVLVTEDVADQVINYFMRTCGTYLIRHRNQNSDISSETSRDIALEFERFERIEMCNAIRLTTSATILDSLLQPKTFFMVLVRCGIYATDESLQDLKPRLIEIISAKVEIFHEVFLKLDGKTELIYLNQDAFKNIDVMKAFLEHAYKGQRKNHLASVLQTSKAAVKRPLEKLADLCQFAVEPKRRCMANSIDSSKTGERVKDADSK